MNILAIACIASLVAGSALGYWQRDIMAKADISKELIEEREKNIESNRIIDNLVKANANKKTDTVIEYRYRTKLVKQELTDAQKSNNCNLSTNTVELLNNFTAIK